MPFVFVQRSVTARARFRRQRFAVKRPPKVPVVLSPSEVRAVLSHLDGQYRLMARLLYGSGLRLLECLRLRVKDVDLHYLHITVRDGKGAKDRITMLPVNMAKSLERHLQKVKTQHEEDLEGGFGSVYLPNAIERKTWRGRAAGSRATKSPARLNERAHRPNRETDNAN